MQTIDTYLRAIEKAAKSKLGERLYHEMEYARRVSLVNDNKYDDLLAKVAAETLAACDREGAITDSIALAAEQALMPMQAACKKYTVLCAGHAHIDMNWMWRYDETVSITLDTFRTMLDLLGEYKDFVFAQSQASTYRIVEEFEPEMLDEIRKYVAEGRWEITASTWVEADRNMPNSESIARHHLYTKRYLPKLLGVSAESLNLDYEPDTFGHSRNVPEMLAAAGVKYYYHCRGNKATNSLYRWRSPSGAEVIVYIDEQFYGGDIRPSMVYTAPDFCESRNMDAYLKVYGVGDHGGGPTRRDLERIVDMGTWPIFPVVKFSTYAEFYARAEAAREHLPVIDRELNYIFTGCYTTQSRIKMGNRVGEALLYEAEGINAFAALRAGAPYCRDTYEKAWRNVLFNQFHDILTGSGVIDTREHAMGLYSQTFAAANTGKRNAMQAIKARIDTSSIPYDEMDETNSEGAGVGFLTYDFKLSPVDRGRGSNRIIHLYNPLPTPRREVVEVVLWDLAVDEDRMTFASHDGKPVRYQIVETADKPLFFERQRNNYWGHTYTRLLLEVDMPALGYTTYVMSESAEAPVRHPSFFNQRLHFPYSYALENDKVRVEFDQNTGAIVSFVEKATGREMVDTPSGIFRYIEEDTNEGMTSWIVGRYMNIFEISESVRIRKVNVGELRNAISIEAKFNNSKVTAVISLDAGSSFLTYDITADWHEIGTTETCVPGLYFHFPHSGSCGKYIYDIPMGVLERDEIDQDLPAQSFVAAPVYDDAYITVVSNNKYGFRCVDDSMNVTLIRAAFEPDPYPEYGIHKTRIRVGYQPKSCAAGLISSARQFIHQPTQVSGGKPHAGDLPMELSFLKASDGFVVSAVKLAEDSDELIIRGYEVNGKKETATLTLYKDVVSAAFCDTLENTVTSNGISISGNTVSFTLEPGSVFTLKVAVK